MKKLVLALGLCLLPSLAWAQNPTCPTRPVGDNTNACASTAFVSASGGAAAGSIVLNVDHVNGVDVTTCGTSVSGSGACKTIYYAAGLFQTIRKVGPGGTANIQSDCGFTETPPGAFLGPIATGNGVLFVRGNETTPTACQWTTGGIHVDDGMVMSLRGFKMIGTGGVNCASVEKMGILVTANIEWGSCAGAAHIAVFQGASYVNDGGTTAVTGSANYHIFNSGGYVSENIPGVAVSGGLMFTAWYGSSGLASADFTNSTYTGAGAGAGTTGQKYLVVGGILTLSGATLPGASAGTNTVGLGGIVDNVPAQIVSGQIPVSDTQGVLRIAQLFTTTVTVDFNSGNTDNAFTITLPTGTTKYRVTSLYIYGASASLAGSTFGLFTSTGGGGLALATGVASTVTTTTDATAANLQIANTAVSATLTTGTLQFRVQTPVGSAATAKVIINYSPVP